MNAENAQMRISIINVPDDLSPLKLRGFLRSQASEIQAKASDHCIAVIRLFLPDRIRLAYSQKRLDALLENIVDRHACIYRIELVAVSQALNLDEMQEAAQEAQADLEEMVEDFKHFDGQGGNPGTTIR